MFRFDYFGAWVFVGVFLGGGVVGGCFGGAVMGCCCYWWLQVMGCHCRGFDVTMVCLGV